MATRKAYRGDTSDPAFLAAFKAWRRGEGDEPAYDEVETEEIETSAGPRLITAEKADEYAAVAAEQAAAEAEEDSE